MASSGRILFYTILNVYITYNLSEYNLTALIASNYESFANLREAHQAAPVAGAGLPKECWLLPAHAHPIGCLAPGPVRVRFGGPR